MGYCPPSGQSSIHIGACLKDSMPPPPHLCPIYTCKGAPFLVWGLAICSQPKCTVKMREHKYTYCVHAA